MQRTKTTSRALGALLVTLTIALTSTLSATAAIAQGAPAGRGQPQGPREVGVMPVAQESVPYVVTLPGRAVAVQETAIRPQVGGEVREIVYQPGRPVATGDILFRLDPETLAAALAAAEAGVAGAQASLTSATATVQRYRKLERSSVSSVDLSDAEVALARAEADLKAAEAARDTAALALRRTTILSPIDGMPDVATVSIGDLVTANQTERMTTITQLDPIYIDVNESSARILRNRERIEAGNLLTNGEASARLILETGDPYEGTGRTVSPGVTVSPTTGTVPIRLEFANPQGLILPGQFLRVEMTIGTTRAVLIPQRATRRASDGTLTAFVARDGTAQQVTLAEAGSYNNSWIVMQGIAEGEMVILDGLENLRAGAEIKTVPVTLDSNGVVRNLPAADQSANAEGPSAVTPAPQAEAAPQAETAPAGTAPAEATAEATAADSPQTGSPQTDTPPARDGATPATDAPAPAAGNVADNGAAKAAVGSSARPAMRPAVQPAQPAE